MESWIFESGPLANPLAWFSIVTAVLAAVIALWFLIARPLLTIGVKIALFFGIAVLPISSATSGNLVGFSTSTERKFCASCHVMEPWTEDSADPTSSSLASVHARNGSFGKKSCYTCHTDYGMFGTVTTKLSGMNHLLVYFTAFSNTPIDEALRTIEIYKPFQNRACIQCHSTRTPAWDNVRDHRGATEEVRSGEVSCASEGCHGPAHPFSKAARAAAEDQP